MKIALIIENSQAAKSSIVHDALKSVAEGRMVKLAEVMG